MGSADGEETVEYQDEFAYQWVSTEYTTNAACTTLPFSTYSQSMYKNSVEAAVVVVNGDAYTSELYNGHSEVSWTGEPIAGQYSVRSGQTDYSIQQCPAWSFTKLGSKLVSVGTPLLNCAHDNFSTSLNDCNFINCTSLESLPEKMFVHNIQITMFGRGEEGIFMNCSALESLPESLFEGCVNAYSFNGCFRSCTSLHSIPSNLFKDCTSAQEFNMTFGYCTFEEVPSNLFKSCSIATTFQNCFYYCKNLKTVPYDLFQGNENVKSFEGTFYSSGLTEIPDSPESLFSRNAAAKSFSSCFANTSVSEIPEHLFDACVDATDFTSTFSGTLISSIPENLFINNAKATTFDNTFWSCYKLISIPEGLFKSCVSATSFYRTFARTSIASIPEDLFASNAEAKRFERTFCGCNNSALSTIPAGLFRNNSVATNFKYTFSSYDGQGGTPLGSYVSIPDNLFSSCPKVTTFASTFYQQTFLQSIPETLFDGCPVASDFSSTFGNCYSVEGKLPELWLRGVEGTAYESYTAPTSYSGCFNGCTKADNYNEAGNYGWN
ncbi:MAG: leucine-rich repeat domain-containing protein [Bacteroidales bacterium]|nr:leucine-rich repeat domain-containing protein [Bacteroidales bacterium]